MGYAEYWDKFFTDPRPEPRYEFMGTFGVTLYFQDYEAAVEFYSHVLGPPAYVEGLGTRGWQIGKSWLTLLKGKNGNPLNVEITFVLTTPLEAERLQAAFVAAGAVGEDPSDQLMYEPVRFCVSTDPFGVSLLAISPLSS